MFQKGCSKSDVIRPTQKALLLDIMSSFFIFKNQATLHRADKRKDVYKETT